MRVLHVLHHSAPHLDGYGVRSQAILRAECAMGLSPVVLTSAHHELEVGRLAARETPDCEVIDDIVFHRTPLPAGWSARIELKTPVLRERMFMRVLGRALERRLSAERFDLIHCHSPVLCGFPALAAARAHGLPLVYEIRAFWEDAIPEVGRTLPQSVKYWFGRRMENRMMANADAIVAISTHMIEDIAARGFPRERLHRIPNGVDLVHFAPLAPVTQLAERLSISGHPTIGFIGSFFGFEGLDCLVRAMPAVLTQIPEARLLLVGDGDVAGEIRQLIAALRLESSVLQVGRVPHHEVAAYYSIIDVMVYPRHRDRLTELVTPLKPLEAIAMGKAVIGSDVGGIKELLDEGRAGWLFRAGDPGDLARQVVRLLEDAPARATLAAQAREYAVRERAWDAIVQGYLPIYTAVTARNAGASS